MSLTSTPAPVNSPAILSTSTSYAARYGEAAEHGCTPLPDVLIRHHRHLGMTYGEWDLTTQILTYKWTDQHPYPTIDALARAMDVKGRQVQDLLSSLQRKGLLYVNERPGRSNSYDLTPMIEKAHALAHLEQGVRKTCTPLRTSQEPTDHAPQPPLARVAEGVRKIPERGAENLHPNQNQRNQKNIERSVPPTPVAQMMERPTAQEATARPQTRFDADYQALVEPLAAIGEELGDQAHPLATTTRAYRLMTTTRLDVRTFLALMERARVDTLSAIQERRRSTPPKPVDNPMAYYFGVLARMSRPDQYPPQWRTGPPRPDVAPAPSLASAPPSNLWEAITAEAAQVMTSENIARWFTPARQIEQTDDALTVAVPDELHKQWLDSRLRRPVEACATRVQTGLQIRFIVGPSMPPPLPAQEITIPCS